MVWSRWGKKKKTWKSLEKIVFCIKTTTSFRCLSWLQNGKLFNAIKTRVKPHVDSWDRLNWSSTGTCTTSRLLSHYCTDTGSKCLKRKMVASACNKVSTIGVNFQRCHRPVCESTVCCQLDNVIQMTNAHTMKFQL